MRCQSCLTNRRRGSWRTLGNELANQARDAKLRAASSSAAQVRTMAVESARFSAVDASKISSEGRRWRLAATGIWLKAGTHVPDSPPRLTPPVRWKRSRSDALEVWMSRTTCPE